MSRVMGCVLGLIHMDHFLGDLVSWIRCTDSHTIADASDASDLGEDGLGHGRVVVLEGARGFVRVGPRGVLLFPRRVVG